MPRKKERVSIRQLLAEVNVLDVENFVVEVEREGKDLVLSVEALSALAKVDTNGRLHGLLDTSGRITEASAATISTNTGTISTVAGTISTMAQRQILATPLAYDAGGIVVGTASPAGWSPIASTVGASTVITADAAGNIGAAADIVAATAAQTSDVLFICQVNTSGSYTTKWCEDASGTPAPTTPDYHTAGHIAYMVAGYPYILRMKTSVDNLSIGYAAGVNGNWPNNAVMYITGYRRGL